MSNSKLSQAVRKALIASGAAVFTLAALPMVNAWSSAPQLGGSAWAAEDGGHSGGSGGHSGGGSGHTGGPPPGKGPGADHGGDHGSDHGDDHGGDDHGSKGKGKGKGGPGGAGGHSTGSEGGESHVPGGAAGGRSGGGGRPVWAKEGIPEVELGRLNVSRAPSHVLDRALNEAVTNEYNPATMGAFYAMTAEDAAAQLSTPAGYDGTARIDSPLQNLGLYKEVMNNGTSPLPGVTPASNLDMAAIFLGSASDKTIPVSEDTVTAVNAILGLPALSPADTTALAAKANAVRAGIAAGHGE